QLAAAARPAGAARETRAGRITLRRPRPREGLALGEAEGRRAGRLQRVDARRQAPPSALPRPPAGQEGNRGGAGIVTEIMGLEISRPDKVLFPDDDITKLEFVQYYADVADAMLPFAKGHPVAMLRMPNGIDGQRFFQKQAPDYFPDFIPRVEIPKSKGTTTYPICDSAKAIVYVASQACIEFHLLPTLADKLGRTDRMVFDFDPSIDDFDGVKRGAHMLKELLDELGLPSYVMTSGSRGLHVWVPLKDTPMDETHDFVNGVADVLVKRAPDLLTTEFMKEA